MVFKVLADVVMVVHLAFIVFVAVGGLLALRWPRLFWLHVPAVAWAMGIVGVGYECPLTGLEKWLQRLSGGDSYKGGFVDRYVEDVIYPGELTPLLRTLTAVLIVAGYVALSRRGALHRREPAGAR